MRRLTAWVVEKHSESQEGKKVGLARVRGQTGWTEHLAEMKISQGSNFRDSGKGLETPFPNLPHPLAGNSYFPLRHILFTSMCELCQNANFLDTLVRL